MTEPLFCSVELAARIERAEEQFIAAGTEAAIRRDPGRAFVTPIAGGFACFADDGAPFNKVVGLGFGGVPDETALDEIESAYAARGSAVQVELAHMADPEVGVLLTGRGYRLVAFENVLGTQLSSARATPPPDGIDVRQCGEDELEGWLDVVVTGFAHPDDQGTPTHEDFPREIVERAERDLVAAGARTYLARKMAWWPAGAACGSPTASRNWSARPPRRSTADGVCRPLCWRQGWPTPRRRDAISRS